MKMKAKKCKNIGYFRIAKTTKKKLGYEQILQMFIVVTIIIIIVAVGNP